MIHHYMTQYEENGEKKIVSWLQINLFGKCFCFSRREEEAPEEPAIPTKWIYDYIDKLEPDTAERNAVMKMFVAWKKDDQEEEG